MVTRTFEDLIGYAFRNPRLLREALTHPSQRVEEGHSYERLEFLGDAVLGATIAEHLFHTCPDEGEGALTNMKSALVSGSALTDAARRLGVGRYAVADKGVAREGLPDSVLAQLLEAVIGAVHLDGGPQAARAFIFRCLAPHLEKVRQFRAASDGKSRLQHLAQRELKCDPTYRIVEEAGPAHQRRFQAAVEVAEREFTSPWAPSKAEAEQAAAEKALLALRTDPQDGAAEEPRRSPR